jgi:hypothetical protein
MRNAANAPPKVLDQGVWCGQSELPFEGNPIMSDWRAVDGVECFGFFFFLKAGIVLQQPGASVPAKDGIVIVRRMNYLSFPKAAHGFREKGNKGV